MNSLSTLRKLLATAPPPAAIPLPIARGLAGLLLVAALAGCSHTPEATAAPPAATPILATAPVVAATPAAAASPEASAPVAIPVVSKPKVGPAKLRVASLPVAEAEPAPSEAPAAAAPAPEPVPAAPTTRTQAGRVLDESGHPLIGATVMLRGSTKGTSTDANGSYSLEVPTGENTFVVGYGGYEDETAVSRDAQPLNVTLLPTPGSRAKGRRSRR
ncbi:hypothetical protein A0257_04665 [Hymenobacter psoromatis]|nr:hypothetical protein A0257_04665 [Hymenobacter psoromatis]